MVSFFFLYSPHAFFFLRVNKMIGYYTKDKPNNKLDIVVVEATAITEDGWIVPGASVGATPELLQMADKIIIEVNTRIPSFEGLHDINMGTLPPNRKPYLIMNTEDRIGTVSQIFIVICKKKTVLTLIINRLLSLLISTRLSLLLKVTVLIKLVVIPPLILNLKLLPPILLSSLKKKSSMVVFPPTYCLFNPVLVTLLTLSLVV